MFIATALDTPKGTLLVLGLSAANITRLQAGSFIDISRTSHGMSVPEGLNIVIFTGETEASMREQMKDLIGATTVQDQMKPL